jgi:3-deoxy-7-phosphoheptulonate synthase
MVDCSHANSAKDHARQPVVARDIRDQIVAGNTSIIGLMIESHLDEGNQPLAAPEAMRYGVSITDACIGWDTTDALLRELHETLHEPLKARRAEEGSPAGAVS